MPCLLLLTAMSLNIRKQISGRIQKGWCMVCRHLTAGCMMTRLHLCILKRMRLLTHWRSWYRLIILNSLWKIRFWIIHINQSYPCFLKKEWRAEKVKNWKRCLQRKRLLFPQKSCRLWSQRQRHWRHIRKKSPPRKIWQRSRCWKEKTWVKKHIRSWTRRSLLKIRSFCLIRSLQTGFLICI